MDFGKLQMMENLISDHEQTVDEQEASRVLKKWEAPLLIVVPVNKTSFGFGGCNLDGGCLFTS